MLFYGPPGTGKTSTILAMCRELYGPELMKTRVLELNASDERGIAVVRDKVKSFAMGAVGGAAGGPPFKIIILDEADSLTHDAQAALRRTMETYSRVTRFCIICNYVSRIIDPLASRCSKYRFTPLDAPAMRARLGVVCDGEGVRATPDTLEAILRISGGDMRKAITFLQSAYTLFGVDVTAAQVIEVAGAVTDAALAPLLTATLGAENANIDAARKAVQGLLVNGFAIGGILEKLCDAVISHATLAAPVKAAVLEKIAQAEKLLAEGADEELQLLTIASAMLRGIAKMQIPSDLEKNYL